MELEYINIDDLKEYEGNAKRHPKKIVKIVEGGNDNVQRKEKGRKEKIGGFYERI